MDDLKKIGILTWYYGANYGAKAQAYALQQVVKSFGYDVCMINYKSPVYKKLNIQTNTEIAHKWLHPIRVFRGINRCRKFEETNRIFYESNPVFSAKDIDELRLNCVILGSDAIFNVLHPLYNDIYYGVGIGTNKLLYSPSCEYLSPGYGLSEACKQSLKEMVTLSVRDNNTRELVMANIGVEPMITLDPTFLYSFDDIQIKFEEEKYILIYSFNDLSTYRKQIIDFAKEQKLKVVSVGRDCDWADKSYSDASFQEWIVSFRNACFVVTDSFHGTVFAIKNKKEVILCSHQGKVAKIESLMNTLGIERTFYDGSESIIDYLNVEIDYRRVDVCLENIVDESKQYLDAAIRQAVKEEE